MFSESVLEKMETDFLIRLSEAELRGFTILPERREEIKRALTTKIRKKSIEEAVAALIYAFEGKYTTAFEFIVNMFPSIGMLIEVSKRLGASEAFIEELEFQKTLKTDYINVSNAEFDIDLREFEHLAPEQRFPAVIEKLVGVSAKDSIIDSKFLKDYFIGKFDLRTTLIVYEIEMMDRLHQHDSKGLIERSLKWQCFVNSNEVMAQMAIEMYAKGCFSALKFIIDNKFSYCSPFSNPIWFQDLSYLFKYANAMHVSKDFYDKVLALASPTAIRKYTEKIGMDKIYPLELENEKDIQTLLF